MQGKHGHLSQEQKQLALRLHAGGWRLIDIAQEIGCTAPMVGRMAREGLHLEGKPFGWQPRAGHLTVLEREEILVGLARGESLTTIARCLGREADVLLQRLGYWGGEGSGLPSPSSFVDESWDEVERDLIVEHPVRGFVARAYLGHATCRICGEAVGSLELTDGRYLWPEGLRHYVAVHAIRLPSEFVEHVRGFTDEIETADVDESWWRSLAK